MILLFNLVSSVLWFIFAILLLTVSLSVSGSETISNWKYILLISVFLMIGLSLLFLRSFILFKRRKVFKTLNTVLINYFYESKYIISLVEFADRGGVDIFTAQKFIETLIKPFNNKIDINQEGMIVYEPFVKVLNNFKNNKSRKKR